MKMHFSLCICYGRNPYGIFIVKSSSDVTTAVICAASLGVKPVVRSGGHSYEELSTLDNALVIDLRNLNSVTVINTKSPRALIQSGAKLGQVYMDLWDQGQYSFNAGNSPSVGIGGHLAGGGKGFQSREYGLAADQIVQMEVVLASGSIVIANATSHSDLFWALRGGGSGSFGVVLSYTVNIFQLPAQTAVFFLTLPLSSTVLDIMQRSFVQVTIDIYGLNFMTLNNIL